MFCHKCGSQVAPEVPFCPNCGQALAAPALAGPAPSTPWTPPQHARAEIGKWIGEGWEIVQADLGNCVLITLIFIALGSVPFIQGALLTGFELYFLKKLSNRGGDIGDLFKGFNFFLPTLLASIVIAIFVLAGTILCIVPGLVVAAMYKFTYLFIADKRMDFWPAMQASHAVVKQDYFGFTMFLLATALVNVLGFLCCIIGLLVTIPLTVVAITAAYRDLVGFDPQTVDRLG